MARNCRATPELAARHDQKRADFFQVYGKTREGATFKVPGAVSNECPVTYVTPQSRWLVQEFDRRQTLRETGLSPWPLARTPIPLADAFVVLADEQSKHDSLLHEKMLSDSRRKTSADLT